MESEISVLLAEAKAKEQERLAADRYAKVLKVEEENCKASLMAAMQKIGVTSWSGAGGSADIVTKDKPYIVDYSALETYIVENRAIDLLQKRLTESAVKLRWDDGIAVPGVGVMTEQKLQLR